MLWLIRFFVDQVEPSCFAGGQEKVEGSARCPLLKNQGLRIGLEDALDSRGHEEWAKLLDNELDFATG